MRRRLLALLLLLVVLTVGCTSDERNLVAVKMVDPPAELESYAASDGRWIMDRDGERTLLVQPGLRTPRTLSLVQGDSESEVGNSVLSAVFGPVDDIYFITFDFELKRWRAGEIEEVLPAGSANGPLLINETRTHLAYHKPQDPNGDYSDIAVLELATGKETVLFERPRELQTFFAWAGDDLWAQLDFKAETLEIVSISLDGKVSPIPELSGVIPLRKGLYPRPTLDGQTLLVRQDIGTWGIEIKSREVWFLPAPVIDPQACLFDEETMAALDWFSSNARPLKALGPHSDVTDLQWLKEALAGVRVIGIGEATHGSKEFRTLMHRLTEFLVMEMGFTAVAIETDYAPLAHVDPYLINHDIGDDMIPRLHSFWQTSETYDLLEWVQEYNQAGNRVPFWGFDLQSGESSALELLIYFGDTQNDAAEEARVLLRRVLRVVRSRAQVSPGQRAKDLEALRTLASVVEGSEYEAHARNLIRYYDYATDPESQFHARDRLMAEAILDQLAQLGPEGKLIVFAHNAHVMERPRFMGDYLRKALGDEYYALALAFSEGGFRARANYDEDGPFEEFWVGPPKEGSTNYYLDCALDAPGWLDFRQAPAEVQAWLADERPMRHQGWGVSDLENGDYSPYRLDHFDGLIHIPKVSPTEAY